MMGPMSEFDWVKARSECSMVRTFLLLAELIDRDVKSANALGRDATFDLNRTVQNRIIVNRTRTFAGASQHISIVIVSADDGLDVFRATGTESKDLLFRGTAALNIDGECRIEVEGIPLHLWQFSRKALEDLFFGF
jgi:hypothetical protein